MASIGVLNDIEQHALLNSKAVVQTGIYLLQNNTQSVLSKNYVHQSNKRTHEQLVVKTPRSDLLR